MQIIKNNSKLAIFLALVTPTCFAEVPAEEAQRLNADLTPMGAERAGNAEGTIPAWDGGYTKVPDGYKSGLP